MCFNEEVSIMLFIMGVLTGIKIIYKGINNKQKNKYYIKLGTITFLVSFMQLLEYVLWKNQECNKTNKIASYLVFILLTIQPIGCLIGAYYSNSLYSANLTRLLVLLCIFILVVSTYFLFYVFPDTPLCSIKDEKSCRLEWAPMTEAYDHNSILCTIHVFVYIAVMVLVDYKFIRKGNWSMSVTGIMGLAFFSTIIYTFMSNRDNFISIYGSFYCFLVVAIIILN